LRIGSRGREVQVSDEAEEPDGDLEVSPGDKLR
jgi:hypothetical protein